MRKKRKVRREIYNNDYIGVVEDISDPKKVGRIKVRIESLHGRKDDKNSISTEHLPWLEPSSRGNSFGLSSIGKVVYVAFEDGDYYKGSYFADEHYDINLQEKLNSLTKEKYNNFYSIYFDAKHQYYYEDNIGVIFDFMKSNINMKDNGDIKLNLKDNSSKLYLGTEDASQQAMLGNHWLDWFDEFIQNLLGAFGGPYLGNLGAPIIPHPKLIENLQKYLALRSTFISKHVFITDNAKIKPQKRKFDKLQFNDNWNTEDLNKINKDPIKLNDPIDRTESGGNPTNSNIPPSNYSDNLSTSIIGENPSDNDLLKEKKPFNDNTGNGKIPLEKMTISTYLNKSFNDDTDERKYLLDEASKSLDQWLDKYSSIKNSDWQEVIATKGYQNFERQQNSRKQYPIKAPVAGKDPFGWGNQVELYFGIDKTNFELISAVKDYMSRGSIDSNQKRYPEIESLDWLIKNSKEYGWSLAGKTSLGSLQWWHWIYLGK